MEMDSKTVLVTGASGFIGHYFCQSAREKGLNVIALSRYPEKAQKRLLGVVMVKNLEELPPGKIHYVVNLAGEPLVSGRWNAKRKQEFIHSRVGVTNQLFEFFKQQAEYPEVLVNGSAVGYYGPCDDELLDENSEYHDSFSHDLCNKWEQSAGQFNELGTRICCLRTGIVLGKGEGALARMLPPFKMGLGGRLGSGKQWMPWIHIEDQINLIFHCLNRSDLNGSVNATAPNPMTNNDFSQTLGRVLSRPVIFPMPAVIARLLFGEMADELLLTGQRVHPRKVLESGFEFQYPELESALKQILATA